LYADFKLAMLGFIYQLNTMEDIKSSQTIDNCITFFKKQIKISQEFFSEDQDQVIFFGLRIAIILVENTSFTSGSLTQVADILHEIFNMQIQAPQKMLESVGFLFQKLSDDLIPSFTDCFTKYLQRHYETIQQLLPEFSNAWLESLIAFTRRNPENQTLQNFLKTIYAPFSEKKIYLEDKLVFEFITLYCQILINESDLDKTNAVLTKYLETNRNIVLCNLSDDFFYLLIKMGSYYHQNGKNQKNAGDIIQALHFFKMANYYYSFLYTILNLRDATIFPNKEEIVIIKNYFEILIYLGEISLAEEIINNYKKYNALDYVEITLKEFKKIVVDNKEIISNTVNTLTKIWSKRNQSFETPKIEEAEPDASNEDLFDYNRN